MLLWLSPDNPCFLVLVKGAHEVHRLSEHRKIVKGVCNNDLSHLSGRTLQFLFSLALGSTKFLVNYAVRLMALALWRTQGCLLYITLPLPLFFRFVVLVT